MKRGSAWVRSLPRRLGTVSNKRALDVPETAIDLGAGTQGTIRRHVMHRRTAGPMGVVLSYTGAHADGVFDVERHRYDDAFGSVRWQPAGRHEFHFATTYFRERSRYDGKQPHPTGVRPCATHHA